MLACSVVSVVPTLCKPVDCCPPDSSVHGIFLIRILDWGCRALLHGMFPFQRSSPHLLQLLHCRRILQCRATGEAHSRAQCLAMCQFQVYSKVRVTHIHVSTLFQFLFPFSLLQNIEQSSLGYTVGLVIIYVKYVVIQLLTHVRLLGYHGLQLTRLLCSWDFPGKNTGVVCHFLLQRIFPTQGWNLDLLYCRQSLYRLSYQMYLGNLWWLSGKETTCNAEDTGDVGSITELRRSLGGAHGNSL